MTTRQHANTFSDDIEDVAHKRSKVDAMSSLPEVAAATCVESKPEAASPTDDDFFEKRQYEHLTPRWRFRINPKVPVPHRDGTVWLNSRASDVRRSDVWNFASLDAYRARPEPVAFVRSVDESILAMQANTLEELPRDGDAFVMPVTNKGAWCFNEPKIRKIALDPLVSKLVWNFTSRHSSAAGTGSAQPLLAALVLFHILCAILICPVDQDDDDDDDANGEVDYSTQDYVLPPLAATPCYRPLVPGQPHTTEEPRSFLVFPTFHTFAKWRGRGHHGAHVVHEVIGYGGHVKFVMDLELEVRLLATAPSADVEVDAANVAADHQVVAERFTWDDQHRHAKVMHFVDQEEADRWFEQAEVALREATYRILSDLTQPLPPMDDDDDDGGDAAAGVDMTPVVELDDVCLLSGCRVTKPSWQERKWSMHLVVSPPSYRVTAKRPILVLPSLEACAPLAEKVAFMWERLLVSDHHWSTDDAHAMASTVDMEIYRPYHTLRGSGSIKISNRMARISPIETWYPVSERGRWQEAALNPRFWATALPRRMKLRRVLNLHFNGGTRFRATTNANGLVFRRVCVNPDNVPDDVRQRVLVETRRLHRENLHLNRTGEPIDPDSIELVGCRRIQAMGGQRIRFDFTNNARFNIHRLPEQLHRRATDGNATNGERGEPVKDEHGAFQRSNRMFVELVERVGLVAGSYDNDYRSLRPVRFVSWDPSWMSSVFVSEHVAALLDESS